jgi:chromosome segregation ATPase
MSRITEMERLELFVANLLEKYNTLLAEKNNLVELLAERDFTIESLESDLASMSDERGEISTRVNGLLGKIEAWEEEVGVAAPVAKGGASDKGGIQGNLFSVDSQDSSAAE